MRLRTASRKAQFYLKLKCCEIISTLGFYTVSFCEFTWSHGNGSLALSDCVFQAAPFLWLGARQQSAPEMSSPQRGHSRHRISITISPNQPWQNSPVLHLLLTAGFRSFKARYFTQLRAKLFNLDLPQLDFWGFFVFFKV